VDAVKKEYRGRVNFEYVNMDTEEGKEKAKEFGVVGYPMLLILDSKGERFSLLQGLIPKEAIVSELDAALANERSGP